MTHDYRAHFERIPGGYFAWLGKRSRKIKAYVARGKAGWTVKQGEGPCHLKRAHTPKLSDFKQDWEAWAKIAWRKKYMPSPLNHTPKPTPPLPVYDPNSPRLAQPFRPPKPGQYPRDLSYEMTADPLDGRYKYGFDEDVYKRKQLTPLGVAIEVLSWCRKHADEIASVPAFAPILDTVRECVHREDPKVYREIMK